MTIRDKLARLDKSPEDKPVLSSPVEFNENDISSFQRELDAKIVSEGNSFIILKENYYPVFLDKNYENLRGNDFFLGNLHLLTNEQYVKNFNLRKTIFIDTETTGLSGGTGTFAFLIGIGHVELDHIVVRQYILPDFQYEWLLLKYIENNLISFDNLVSFNGKSYDIPLIRNRYILNRMETVIDELSHIDLLHVSRRVWKRRLTSCDLQNLEYVILGKERINDIPGEMVPQIYFEYIRKKKAALLRDVLEHNYHDIVNLILLTIRIGQVAENPLEELSEEEDIISLAKYYYSNKNYVQAMPVLQHQVNNCHDTLIKNEAIYILSMCYKKTGEYEKSMDLMKYLLERQQDHPDALEELAKYYEHTEKNISAALHIVEEGISYLQVIEQLKQSSPIIQIKESLFHRKKRLLKKLSKGEN